MKEGNIKIMIDTLFEVFEQKNGGIKLLPYNIAMSLIKSCKIIKCKNNEYYCPYGLIDEREIKRIITTAMARKVDDIPNFTGSKNNAFSIFEDMSFRKDLSFPIYEIPVENGTIKLKNNQVEFCDEYHITPYRLPTKYNPNAPRPKRFMEWLNDLFYEDDIKGFQEFMGYCLIPTTIGQMMLVVMGNGEEGKSIIGIVLKNLLGDAWVDCDIRDIEENRFTSATLDKKLVGYQDDKDDNPLKSTNNIKKIITGKGRTMVEKKGIDKYEGEITSRLIVCSNFPLSAVSDNSEGFYRRIYPIRVKPKPKDRIVDSHYDEPMMYELEGILNWCIEGLLRLMKNNFKFSISPRSRELQKDMREEGNTIDSFIKDRVIFEKDAQISVRDLYITYEHYCQYNKIEKQGTKQFGRYIKAHMDTLNIKKEHNREGDYYIGMKVIPYKNILLEQANEEEEENKNVNN